MEGPLGFEPRPTVMETVMLPLLLCLAQVPNCVVAVN